MNLFQQITLSMNIINFIPRFYEYKLVPVPTQHNYQLAPVGFELNGLQLQIFNLFHPFSYIWLLKIGLSWAKQVVLQNCQCARYKGNLNHFDLDSQNSYQETDSQFYFIFFFYYLIKTQKFRTLNNRQLRARTATLQRTPNRWKFGREKRVTQFPVRVVQILKQGDQNIQQINISMKALQLLVTLLFFLGVMTQSPYGIYADLLLSLSDKDLYEAALKRRVGKCFITPCKAGQNCACDLYAQVSIDSDTTVGLPDLYGTGCVCAPDMPKKMSTCWGNSNNYPFYNKTPTPICSKCGIANAANMIRIGITKGYCKLPICVSYPKCPVFSPK